MQAQAEQMKDQPITFDDRIGVYPDKEVSKELKRIETKSLVNYILNKEQLISHLFKASASKNDPSRSIIQQIVKEFYINIEPRHSYGTHGKTKFEYQQTVEHYIEW